MSKNLYNKFNFLDKSTLEELYLKKRLSLRKIGEHFGCNGTTILDKLIKFNIPRRKRNEIIIEIWKTNHPQKGKKLLGRSRAGSLNPFYGKKHTPETIKRFSASLKGRVAWNKGLTKETSESIRLCGEHGSRTLRETGASRGEKNPNWRGGKSYEPYSFDWTKELKKKIKDHYNGTCQLCFGDACAVHHIDYNKKNCHKDNLVALCRSCHSKTNYNREFWESYFMRSLITQKDGAKIEGEREYIRESL